MTDLNFGRVQLRIMRVLWEKKRLTAREITDELNKTEPISHSTVQTLLRTLEDKDAVDHDIEDRTFIFFPKVKNEKVLKHAVNGFIDSMFAGSAEGMVSYLVKNQYISPEEYRKILESFDEQER